MKIKKERNGRYLIDCCRDEVRIINMMLIHAFLAFKINQELTTEEKHLMCAIGNMARSIDDTVGEIRETLTDDERKMCMFCPSVHNDGPEACRMVEKWI